MKVYAYTHDPMLNLVYIESEAEDLFGECDEFLIDVPEELVLRSQTAYADLLAASKEIALIIEALQEVGG